MNSSSLSKSSTNPYLKKSLTSFNKSPGPNHDPGVNSDDDDDDVDDLENSRMEEDDMFRYDFNFRNLSILGEEHLRLYKHFLKVRWLLLRVLFFFLFFSSRNRSFRIFPLFSCQSKHHQKTTIVMAFYQKRSTLDVSCIHHVLLHSFSWGHIKLDETKVPNAYGPRNFFIFLS